MKNYSKLMMAAFFLVCSGGAFAHPGHGIEGFLDGFNHPMGGVDHLLSMLVIGLWAGQMGGKSTILMPVASLIVMGIAAIGAMFELFIPFSEVGIFLTLVVVGLAVALKIKLPLPIAFPVIGAFSICHGYAHGVEMPFDVNGLEYGLGLAIGSAILLGAGIALSRIKGREHIVSWFGAVIAFIGLGLLAA